MPSLSGSGRGTLMRPKPRRPETDVAAVRAGGKIPTVQCRRCRRQNSEYASMNLCAACAWLVLLDIMLDTPWLSVSVDLAFDHSEGGSP